MESKRGPVSANAQQSRFLYLGRTPHRVFNSGIIGIKWDPAILLTLNPSHYYSVGGTLNPRCLYHRQTTPGRASSPKFRVTNLCCCFFWEFIESRVFPGRQSPRFWLYLEKHPLGNQRKAPGEALNLHATCWCVF